MDLEQLREYCISYPGTSEGFPFDEETLVFKVMGKMFALVPLEHADRISLKCDPEYAIELREKHPDAIEGAWHMNKKHWNTVYIYQQITEKLLRHLVKHSYDLVVSKLKKADKLALKALSEESEL